MSETVRKPFFLWYWLMGRFARPFVKFVWGNTIIRDKNIKKLEGPIVAIGNHCSTIDIMMSVQALLPRRYNIVTGKDLFTWKELKPFIKGFGCIPKSQCTLDLASMRVMKDAVDHGRNLLIYPEGKTSMDGTELKYLPKSIGKFLKFLDANVVVNYTLGAYITRPRFCKGFKRGKTVTKTYVLMTKEQLKEMKPLEVYEKVKNALKFNDNIYQQENHIRFRSKTPAQNLNYILYKCPKCGAEYEMSSDGRNLKCGKCNNTVEYTEYGELIPTEGSKTFDRLDQWFDFERKSVLAEVKEDNFHDEKPVKVSVENHETEKFEERGEGKVYITKEEIGFIGRIDGKEITLSQSLKGMNSIVTKTSESIDLTFEDTIYRFLFTDHKWSVKYGLYVEEIFALSNGFVE